MAVDDKSTPPIPDTTPAPIDLTPVYGDTGDVVRPAPSIPTMSAAPAPGPIDRVWNAIKEGIPAFNDKFEAVSHTDTGTLASGETPKMQLITPEAAMTESEKKAHPIATGVAEVAGSLTSPGNVAMMAGTGGFGELPGVAGKLVPKLISLGFSMQSLKGAYDQIPAFKKAMDAGDESEAERIFTHIVLDTAVGVAAGKHATEGAVERVRTGIENRAEAKAQELDRRADAAKNITLSAPEQLPAVPEAEGGEVPDHIAFTKLGGKELRGPNSFGRTGGPFGRAVDVAHQVMREHGITGPEKVEPEITAEGPEWDRVHSAVVDGNKVGSVGYHLDPEGTAQIYGSQVSPELRGKGIGQKLYQSVIEDARDAGASRITSDSTNTTPDANRVWEKLREKGMPVEDITHANGKPGYQIDFEHPPESAPEVLPEVPEAQHEATLARRGELPNQSVNMKDAYGDTGNYVGGHVEYRPQQFGVPESREQAHARYTENLGVTHGPDLMEIPADILPDKADTKTVLHHELGHVIAAHLMGIPLDGVEVQSHLHPDIGDSSTMSAATQFDWSQLLGATKSGRGVSFTAEGIQDAFPKLLHTLLGGGIAQELIDGHAIKDNEGMKGDMAMLHRLGSMVGLNRDQMSDRIQEGMDTTRKMLNDPSLLDIIKKSAATREDGLSKTLHISAAKIQDVVRQVRESQNAGTENRSTREGNRTSDASVDTGRAGENVARGAGEVQARDNVPAKTGFSKKVKPEISPNSALQESAQKYADVFESAAKQYGTTEDINKAGYVGPDGRMLDFSDGQKARTLDHGDIASVPGVQSEPGTNPRNEFAQKTGAIRFVHDPKNKYLGLQISEDHPPTSVQLARFEPLLAEGKGVEIEIVNNKNVVGGSGIVEANDLDGLDRAIRDAQKDAQKSDNEISSKLGVNKNPDWLDAASDRATKEEAGGIDPRTGKSDTKGVGVEIIPELRQPIDHAPTADDFKNFYDQHKDVFDKNPELRVGWDNKSAVPGGHEINVGAVGDDAARVAKKLDQKAAFDITKGENIPTKGSGLRIEFPNYPLEDRIKDLKGEPLSDIKGFEHLSSDVYNHLEPDERAYLHGNKLLQRNTMAQYHKISPSVPETTNAMQAGAALGGWWQRYMDIFHELAGGGVQKPSGIPLFHGTSGNFADFDPMRGGREGEFGTHLGTQKQAHDITNHLEQGQNIRPVYADIKNPVRMEDYGHFAPHDVVTDLEGQGIFSKTEAKKLYGADEFVDPEKLRAALEKKGYDGIVYLNRREGVSHDAMYNDSLMSDTDFAEMYPEAEGNNSYIAFRPEQIKPRYSAEYLANTIGPSHAEVLKQWHAAVSGNKSIQDANNLAWHSYADWLDAGKPTDRKSINDIVLKNGAQPEGSGKKGNAAISDTLNKKGKVVAKGLDTNKLFNLINSPEMRGEKPFGGDVYGEDETKNPLMGPTQGARKIPSMGATVAGKGNLNRLVIDAHIRDFYGRQATGGPAAQYIADSAHLRQAAGALGLKGGEGQEQLWGTVLGLKTLLKQGLTPEEASGKLNSDVINTIGKDYAEVIANDPEISQPGGVLDRLKQVYGIGRGSAGVSAANRQTPGSDASESEPTSGEASADKTQLAKTAERIRGTISESKIKKPGVAPAEDDTSFNFGANEAPLPAPKPAGKSKKFTALDLIRGLSGLENPAKK